MYYSMKNKLLKLFLTILFCLILISIYCSYRDANYQRASTEYEKYSYNVYFDENGKLQQNEENKDIIQGIPNEKPALTLTRDKKNAK